MYRKVTTEDELVEHFDGILIPVEDIAGKYSVPGWRCKHCGWGVGSMGFPPGHMCPDDGDAQRAWYAEQQQAQGD